MHIDVFNGDADGITALHQWRMEHPVQSRLVSGVKRDIELLSGISPDKEDSLAVFDISVKSNLGHLDKFLDKGVEIVWFDHHQRGNPPEHRKLFLYVNESSGTCTSNIVNEVLGGKYAGWAAVGAFGDNAKDLGVRLALDAGVVETDILENLGMLLNYNSYGESPDDLHFNPAEVYRQLSGYEDPVVFFKSSPMISGLEEGLKGDMIKADTVKLDDYGDRGAIYYLPDEKWARRITGTFANARSTENPNRANAVLLRKDGGWLVSVRAPKSRPCGGADILCSSFDSGGGRAAAAGINFLPDSDLAAFADRFKKSF